MTFDGWVAFAIFGVCIAVFGGAFTFTIESVSGKVFMVIVTVVLIVALLFGMLWYFQNTASGQRKLIDQKSNFENGLDRTITVYTADGNVIATYTGKIDIEDNDGGYVIFDYQGKRYTYYNCFVESIADIY